MKDLLSRYWQNLVLVLIVAGLLILAFGGYMRTIGGYFTGVYISTQTWIATRYSAIQDFVTVPRDVITLAGENTDLRAEVSRLQAQVIELQQQVNETQILSALVGFARANPESTYVAATVIGRDPSPFLQYIIINRGSNDSVRRGMPVVTDQGLIGRVDAVIANAARVQLVTDANSLVNVRLQGAKTDAVLLGSLTGDLTLDMISQDVTVEPGDVVLTSGLGGAYPADLVLGQVISVRKLDFDLFQTAIVQPVVDFSRLQIVLVITNFRPIDISPLSPGTVP